MKVIDLGLMKIPLEGPWPVPALCVALAWGWLVGYMILLCYADSYSGPALQGNDLDALATKCGPIAWITILWSLMAKNCMGIQTLTNIFLIFQIWKPTDLNAQYHLIARRATENTQEQALFFLVSLWTYALFVDSATAVPIGIVYVFSRALYPILYALPGEFTVAVEAATQPSYMACGILAWGVLKTTLLGGDWKECITTNVLGTSWKAFAIGFFTLVPGMPLGPIYFAVHSFSHKRWKRRQEDLLVIKKK